MNAVTRIKAGRSTVTSERLIESLAAIYRDSLASDVPRVDPMVTIARLCDDHLDPTGLLLGQVRDAARHLPQQCSTCHEATSYYRVTVDDHVECRSCQETA